MSSKKYIFSWENVLKEILCSRVANGIQKKTSTRKLVNKTKGKILIKYACGLCHSANNDVETQVNFKDIIGTNHDHIVHSAPSALEVIENNISLV